MAGTPNDPWAVDSIVPDAQASADDWGVDSVIDDAPKASVGDWDVAEIVADKPVGAPGDSELPPLDLEALGREQEAYEEKNPFFTRMGQRFKRGALGSVVGEHAGNAVTSADTILRAQSDASLSPEERANKITASAENLATSLALFAKTQKSVAGIPEAPVVAAARGRGLKDTLRAASVDPIAFIGEHGATSAFPSAQMGVDAAVGGRLAGKKGAIGSAGLASFNVDYLSGLVESIAEAGVDISDPAAVKQALLNPEFLDAAKKSAGLHASVVGLLDALSIGVASKVLAPAGVKSKLARELINVPPQVAAQGVLGGAGEAGGQLLDKGEVDDWSAVVAEVAGEAVTAPGDVAMAAVGGIREQQAKRRAERQQDQQAVDELNRAYNPDAEPEISVSPDDLYKDTQAAGEPAGQAIEAPEVETTGVEQYIAGAGPGDAVAGIPEVSPGFQEDPGAVAEQPIAPRGTPETSGFEPVNEAGEPEYFDGRLKRSTYRDALVRTLDRDFTEGGGVAVVPDHRYRPGESDKPGERPMIRTPSVNPSWVQSILGDNGISVAEVKKAAAKSLRGEPLGVRQARVVSQILDQITEERTSPAEMDAARRQLEDAREVRRWINRDLASAGEIESLAGNASELVEAGELFAESAYGFNQTGVQRVLYEVAEEARALGGDDAQIETILDTRRDDAEVLREMVRYTESLRRETRETEATATDTAAAQRGPAGDAAPVQRTPEPEAPPAGEAVARGETTDFIGGKNPTAQAIRDRQEDRKRQERDAPDIGAGPGDLFSGKAKQTDIEDAPGAKERRRDAERRKRVAEMSQDELRRELLTDSLTGLPNRRAYDEAEHLGVQAAIDADSLKWVNDNLGHDAGDKLLQAIGQALAESGLDAYHISGDEFVVQADDQAALERALDAVRLRLDNARLVAETPDGVTTIKRGIHFSYGIGATRHEADQALNRAKAEREAKGLRAARGKEPPGVARTTQGKPPEKDSAPTEVTDKTPSKEGVSVSTNQVPTPTDIGTSVDDAAREAATSPDNDKPEPTDAQKEAGNYAKGHTRIGGLDIAIENPAGSKRRPEWPALVDHYGYIKGTVGKDKDHLDVFVLAGTREDYGGPVFVIDQVKPDGDRAFDEHKIMLGWGTADAARQGYLANYTPGWKGYGAIKQFTLDEFKLWLKDGNTKKPVALDKIKQKLIPVSKRAKPEAAPSESINRAEIDKPVTTVKAEPEKQGTSKIEDFGETIEGARKHYAEAYRDKLREALDADIAAESLSKTWPEPEYDKLLEAGADTWVVAFVHASRDEIPAKPRQSWRLKGWVEQVKLLRDIARKMLDGTVSKERVQEKLDDKQFARLKTEISGRAELYQAVGHGQSLKGVRVSRGSYSIFQGVEHKPAKIIWTVEKKAAAAFSNWPTTLASGDTREEAIADFRRAVAAGSLETKKPADKEVSFAIYSYRRGEKVGRYYIGKKIGKEYVDLESFDSAKTAREYLATNRERLVEKLQRLKYVPNERKETNDPRVGVDHRNAADVTPAQFSEAFGFRGVQFGNWVEGGRRQQDLNEAYDALMDLAGVLGVPPKALSLNGELGLAFGARGAGAAGVGRGFAAKAHYEPGHVVINLTKEKGAGSLAHEWWHALDNYFSRARQDKEGYLTEKAHPRGEGVRPEMVEAFRKVITTVNESGLRERSNRLDKTRTKPYWSTGREMTARAFESYVIEKLRDQGVSNDYLANIVSQAYWDAAASLGLEKEGTYPYPEAAEIPVVRAAFDHFFRTVETKDTDQGVALFSRTPRDFAKSVDGVLDGAIDEEARIDLGETPAVLRAVGLPDMPLVTTGDVIDKVHYDHGLTRDQIKGLPDLLADPIAVFESDTRPGTFVVVVDAVGRGMPVVVAVHPNRRMGRTEVNFLASAYPKQNAAIQLKRWVKAGLLRYINKSRSPAWQTIVGVQFPEMGPAERGSGKIVLTEADVVKADDDPKLSRRAKPGAEPSVLARSLTGVAANLKDRAHLLEQAGGGFTVTGASLLDDYLDQHKAEATDDLRVAKALQDAFGAPVALVASQGTAGFRGVYHQGIIWLNADSDVSLPVVFGHELTHRLEKENPGIYQDLRAALGPLLTNTKEYERQYGLDDVSDDTLVSEMIADLMGDRFAEPAFWQQVAANTTSSKFKRIVTAISLWIDKLLARIKGFGSHRFVADLEAARRILANAVRNFAEERSKAMATPGAAPVFYSQLDRVLTEKLPNAGTAADLRAMIEAYQKNGDVKKEEVEWSGILEWLAGIDGKVTKQRVLEFVRANQIQVTETELGGEGSKAYQEAARTAAKLNEKAQALWREVDQSIAPVRGRERSGLPELARNLASDFENDNDATERVLRSMHKLNDEQIEQLREYGEARIKADEADAARDNLADDATSNTKFETYTLPGGQNYRELLLTLPRQRVETAFDTYRSNLEKTYGPILQTEDVNRLSPAHRAEFERLRDAANAEYDKGLDFLSQHFNEPNILAHIRFNERTDADGKRVLFIEEVQSDWAQKGRRDGFTSGNIEEIRKRLLKKYGGSSISEIWSQATNDEVAEFRAAEGAVPTAPFITKTDSWSMLAMKRMIRYAAENGFDRIAWTTGEQQADRYDLSKRIKSVQWNPDTGRLNAYDHDSRNVISQDGVTRGNLADYIGKEAAEKLINTPTVDSTGGPMKWLGDQDLKIGGEGMKAFYDQMLPSMVGKYVKKWGGKVTTTRIDAGNRNGNRWAVVDATDAGDAQVLAEYKTKEEAEAALETEYADGGVRIEKIPVGEHTVPAIDITDAMRDSALRGQPLFARRPDHDVAGAPEFHKRIRDWLFDHLKTAKKVNLWSRTVGTQYHLAHKVPAFKPVFDAGQAFLADVSRLAVEAESRAPNLFRQMNTISQAVKTGGASNTDIEAIATPIYTGTVEDQRVYDAAELRDRFKLNPKQIRLYEQALDATHKSLDDMAMASLHRVARAMGLDRAALTRIARRSKSAAEFLERVYRQALKPAREEIDGRIKQLQAIAGAATTDDAKASAQAAIAKIEDKKKRLADDTAGLYKMLARVNQLKSEGYFPLMRFGKYSVDVVSQEGGAPVREAFLTFETEGEANAAARALREEYPEAETTQGVMSQDAWRLFPGLTPDVVEAFARQVGASESDLFQQWLKVAVGNRSAMKRLIKRKNIPGFSKDVNRTLATFILANARLAAANYHMPDMLEATQAIPKEMGDVKDQAVMLREYMLNPTEEFARFRSFLFFDFIGGSMASAMVNLTQIPMATFPYLAQGGAVGAARAVAKWMKPGAKPLDAQHAADLQRAEEEGVVSPQEVHNLMAVARGGTLGASRVLSNRHVQTGLYVWGFMFSTAEQYNRRVTFNAAYDVGRSRGVANAYDFAVKAVNESQFIYNRGNRPKWARGIGAPIFTFKQFTISYLELIARMPARQKAAMIALIILAAGVRGLPFEEDLEDLLDTIMQWRGYNWQTKREMAAWAEETLGKELADFAQHGVSTWLPFDLQGRLGFGNLIPGTAAFKVSETDKSREVSEVLGVSAAVARSVGQGLEKVAKGDPRGAAKVLAPKAVKDFWQGLDMLMDGEYRDPHGNLVTKDVRTVEAVSKMMGLHPRNVAQLQKRNIMAADAKAMHRATEDGIADKWARGIALKDPKLKAEARADLKNYNRKNPGRRIEITERQIMSRVEQMRMDLKKRSVKNTPSELRKDVKRDLGG